VDISIRQVLNQIFQRPEKNQESTNKILEELVVNDPVSLKSSTNENMPLGRIEM
jgi:hypothetical protein